MPTIHMFLPIFFFNIRQSYIRIKENKPTKQTEFSKTTDGCT